MFTVNKIAVAASGCAEFCEEFAISRNINCRSGLMAKRLIETKRYQRAFVATVTSELPDD